MSKITQVFEDMASGRPIKKPVKTNLLKARKDANEKALKSGFMKMPDYVKKTFEEKEEEYKPHMMYKGDKKVMAKKKEDHDRLNKQGYDHDDPKTKKIEEEKGRGPTGISYTVTPGHPDAENPKTGKKYPERQTSAYKSKWKEKSKPGLGQNVGTKNPMNEAKKNCGCGQDPCITYGKGGKMEKMNEAKKKGLDGKECWDGYKQMGTKMKGGKRVDNCVKMKEEIIAEISDDMKMRYIKKANKQITSAEKERLAGKGHAVKTDKDYDRLVSKPLKRRQGVAKARANLGEISDHMKTRYIHKSMRDIDTKERASQLADKQGAPAEVGKSLSKSTGKRRKGIARARANLERPIKESSSWVQQTADTWNDHADHKHPKVQKHIKKAETAYNNKDMEAFHHHTTRAADHAHSLKKNESYDRMSWPTHNRHRQRTSARVTADTLNSPTILKKRQEMHPAARKAYDNKVRDNNNKKYGYHPEIGHKQNKTTALPKHLHHPKVGLNDSIQRDVYMSLLELSPKTISSYQKKAGAQYRDLKKSTMSATSREGGYHKGYISDKEYDAQHQMADKKARRGKGLAMSAGKGVKKEEVQQVDELKKSTLGSYIKRATGDAISRSHSSQFNLQRGVEARDKGDKKGAKAHFKKSEKESKKTMDRFHGINRAAGKLTPGKNKDEYLADKNPVKVGGYKTFKQKHSSNVKATNESLNKLIGQAVDKIEAASDKVKKKVKIKNASIKNPSTY